MDEGHTEENGFAFFLIMACPISGWPGVKGVIRCTAEELAADLNPDGTRGWTFIRVMWLLRYEENVGYIDQLDLELYDKSTTGEEANALLEDT